MSDCRITALFNHALSSAERATVIETMAGEGFILETSTSLAPSERQLVFVGNVEPDFKFSVLSAKVTAKLTKLRQEIELKLSNDGLFLA